jgi:hypothetical protein
MPKSKKTGHKVGDKFYGGGGIFKVTKVDSRGRILKSQHVKGDKI